jgi:hypothetical protein
MQYFYIAGHRGIAGLMLPQIDFPGRLPQVDFPEVEVELVDVAPTATVLENGDGNGTDVPFDGDDYVFEPELPERMPQEEVLTQTITGSHQGEVR